MKETKIEVCKRIAKMGNSAFVQSKFKQRKIQETLYYQSPRKCLNCNQILYFDQQHNKFCNSKCSGSYNTKGRILSDETKKKISSGCKDHNNTLKDLKGYSNPFKGLKKETKFSKIYYAECSYCHNIFIRSYPKGNYGRITCSDKCMRLSQHNRTYLNGSRKTIYYLTEDKGLIILESTWEELIAILLDKLRIKWIRPKPMEWFDLQNKIHLYYPDFYLVDHNVYLDPKNPYCMIKDQEKMKEISVNNLVIYGDISIVENYIKSIV